MLDQQVLLNLSHSRSSINAVTILLCYLKVNE